MRRLALVVVVSCCGGSPASTSADASSDHSRPKDAAPDADVDAGVCGRVGYVLDDDYDARCGFCYASAPEYLPQPIQWEPCSANAFPSGVVCEQMRRTWPASAGGQYFEGLAKGYVDGAGHAVLAFGIASGDTFQEIVAEADGATLTTWLELAPITCATVTTDARDGFFAMHVYASQPIHSGSIGGSVANLHPHSYAAFWNDYRTSSLGLLERTGNALKLYDWSTGIPQVLYQASSPDQISSPVMTSNAVFFEASNSTNLRQQVWSADAGVRDLISYGADPSQGAGSLGTDGNDLVWTHGSNGDGGIWSYPDYEIVTSPYTTSAPALQPRHLRSEGSCSLVSDEYVVGCGYAMHPTCAYLPSEGLRIVRLADGRSWPLVSDNGPFAYVHPIAITCDELFATVSENNVADIVRIKLASLGVGDPPD